MDVDLTLAQIRSAIDEFETATNNVERALAARSIIEHFEALDQWLSREGFLPTPWQRATVQPN